MSMRRGFNLFELMASCLVLAVLLTACLQLVRATGVTRRATAQRQTALEEAANALERIGALGYAELTLTQAQNLLQAERIAERLPGGRAEVTVDSSADAKEAKRVAVTIAWRTFPQEPERTVHLVTWKYPLPVRGGG